MFRLRTFGGLWLERDRERVSGVSPRRLGVLAAVVAAGNNGISRDRLLLLLWPDSTEVKARHALSQTLYSLRRELGSELVRAEAAELLIDRTQLESDYTDFLEARNAGDVERAAALYTGPFLDGFYVPEAPEFERWAEEERSRLRELAIVSIESAARLAGTARRHEDALAYWRRLSVLAPHNSRFALGLMTALADSGDVAGAIQHGRAHELARRQEVGAQPDPSVTALLTRLTKGEWRPSALIAPSPSEATATLAPPAAPLPGTAASTPRRTSRRGMAIAGGAALVLAGSLWLLRPLLAREGGFPVGSVIVLSDPKNETGEPGLDRAIASAATVGLQQSRHLTLMPPTRITETLRRMGRGGDSLLNDSLALEVAARQNARAVLALSVSGTSGGKYSLTGRLLSPIDGSAIAVHRVSVDSRDEVIEGLDDLVRRLQGSAGDPSRYRDSLPPLPLVTTSSLEALKLYAEGRDWWRRSRYDQAAGLFQRAVLLDSNFALAHVALGHFYYWNNNRPSGDVHYVAAQRLRDRLTQREQMTLDSRLASAHGNRAEASRIERMIAERYPSGETWYDYGTSLMMLQRCEEGIPALQRALSIDSTMAHAHINLATCYKSIGENRLALDAYAAAERMDSVSLVSFNINHEWGSVFVRLGRYAEAEAAFRRMLALSQPLDQARGHRSLGYLNMLLGRYRSAIAHLTSAVNLSKSAPNARLTAIRNEALLAEAYQVIGSRELASRELDEALRLSRGQFVEPGFLALLGRVLVRAGRLADAQDVLVRVEKTSQPDNPIDKSARGLLAAEIAIARGQQERAAEAIRGDVNPTLARWRESVTGRILAARGVLDSALAVTAGFARQDGFGWDNQADWVFAPLELARIAERMGDSATARSALQTFLERWRDADSGLVVLRDARAYLARLQREARR